MPYTVRIIPLLIVVALLSFSVRIAEVVYSVNAIPGAALAEEGASEEDHAAADTSEAEHVTDTEEGTDHAADADTVDSNPQESDASEHEEGQDHKANDGVALDETKWRDPGDEVPGYEAVKQEVMGDMAERSKVLDSKEKTLNTRAALLDAAEKELEQKYKELSQLRDEIKSLLGQQSEQEEARIKSLVKVYEGMKPKDAARIFNTLDLDILMDVMGEMSERKMSPILAAMDPERARTVTIMLVEQKKLPSLPQ